MFLSVELNYPTEHRKVKGTFTFSLLIHATVQQIASRYINSDIKQTQMRVEKWKPSEQKKNGK